MMLNIFAVFDRKTAQYGTPMFMISEGQCIRSFSDELNRNDAQNALFAHPDDYDLYEMGAYDTATGVFTTASPILVVAGSSVAIRSK